MLGVGVFFTLSGYLITDLLLGHWNRYGELGLRTFWLRRARRLLPALFLMLVVVSICVAIFDAVAARRRPQAGDLGGASTSPTGPRSPSTGPTSRALPRPCPWTTCGRCRSRSSSTSSGRWLLLARDLRSSAAGWRFAVLTLALAGARRIAMASLYHPGYDPTRVYEGTDTRAFGLLIGAALAMVWPSRSRPARSDSPARSQRTRRAGGRRPGRDPACWSGGPTRVLAVPIPVGIRPALARHGRGDRAARQPGQPARGRLGWRPLRWIGRSLLRHLSLAMADHRPGGQPRTRDWGAAGRARGGRDDGDRRGLVALRRGADPPRRHPPPRRPDDAQRPPVGASASRARHCSARRRRCWRSRGRDCRGCFPPHRAAWRPQARARALLKAAPGSAASEGRASSGPSRRTAPATSGRPSPPTPRAARSYTSATRPPRERSRPTTSPTRGSACEPSWRRSGSDDLLPGDFGRPIDRRDLPRLSQRATVAQSHIGDGFRGVLDHGPRNQRRRRRARRAPRGLAETNRADDVDHRPSAGAVGGDRSRCSAPVRY